jgi:FkbM family methyltransferase
MSRYQQDKDVIKLETIHGHTYYLPEGKIPFQEDAIKQSGVYEPATTAAIYKYVKPGMNVIEGGACCGYHALNLAKAVGSEGRVSCFEANPDLVDILKKNVEINGYEGYVEINHAGLWFQESVLPFPLLSMGLGGASFKNTRQLAVLPTVPVRMVALDDLFSDKRVDFIRMDIEGAELEALKGAETILGDQQPAMILEWIPDNSSSDESVELFELLKKFDYQIYRITSEGLKKVADCEDLLGKYVATHERDILCCREII